MRLWRSDFSQLGVRYMICITTLWAKLPIPNVNHDHTARWSTSISLVSRPISGAPEIHMMRRIVRDA